MLAAGGSIEPFWAMYKQHNKAEVREILAEYLIGELEGEASETVKIEDPFKNEPQRHPALITHRWVGAEHVVNTCMLKVRLRC